MGALKLVLARILTLTLTPILTRFAWELVEAWKKYIAASQTKPLVRAI